jgi:hypothetical protein
MKKTTFLVILIIAMVSCTQKPKAFKVAQEPTDKLVHQLRDQDYSIVLNDMDIEKKKIKDQDMIVYKHKYHVLKLKNDSLIVDSLDWKPVNEKFFQKYEKDLGMEIVSHHNGKLSKVSQPVGHGWAVGNPKYGEWVTDSTQTAASNSQNQHRRRWRPHTSGLFWFWMLRRPYYQRDYNNTRTYRSAGKTYYGKNGRGYSTFGTGSKYQEEKRGGYFRRSRTSNTWKNYKKKTSRSSSRYSGSSKTRSRSGGFGK